MKWFYIFLLLITLTNSITFDSSCSFSQVLKTPELMDIKLVNYKLSLKFPLKEIHDLLIYNYSSGFISTWDTSQPGFSNSTEISLPLLASGSYNFTVAWGDGKFDKITSYNSSKSTHNYGIAGIFTVNITGTIIGWSFNWIHDAPKLIQISHWGNLQLGNTGYYFAGAWNLVLTAVDSLNLTGTNNLTGAFEGCSSLGDKGAMNSWNTTGITNMSSMFALAISFNQDINLWDVSNVQDMSKMFFWSFSFNQSLSNWNVSNVRNMSSMFLNTHIFNQPLDSWDVSNVQDMNNMFNSAGTFNQPLTHWNVAHVRNMQNMFAQAETFNQPLANWNVSKVRQMGNMFNDASDFNQSLDNWNVSQVQDMSGMFNQAYVFNQPLSTWNVSQVQDMSGMFDQAYFFNQPLSTWNVSHVLNMSNMFSQTRLFNQQLSSWDVSHVLNMTEMFASAKAFNQPLGSWNVSNVQFMTGMFSDVSLSVANYDDLLLGWSQLSLRHSVIFDAGYSKYSSLASKAKSSIINNFGWIIIDGGLNGYSSSSSVNNIPILIYLVLFFAVVLTSLFASMTIFSFRKK